MTRSPRLAVLAWAALLVFAPPPRDAAAGDGVYARDVRFALDELEKQCDSFFRLKGIEWDKVEKTFLKEAGRVKNDQEHLVLLTRLLARLEDGHAAVKPLDKGKDVRWPDDGAGATVGPGMFWCRIGKKIHVKNAWSSAAASGVKPGMEVVTVNGAPAAKWLEARIEEIRDTQSYSTDQQAFFSACHWGLADAPGARMELEVADTDGKKKKRTVTYTKASVLPDGPAFPPPDLQGTDDVRFGTTPKGYAYIHVRRCPDNLPELTDQALAAVGDAPGLILDFRACGGGAFDHEAFLGRFVPKGETLSFAGSYPSAGESPYGGPIVVIVDAGARSAGETGSGIFKEDGRAYLIGESPTAGMSSQKTTIELPSGLFALYVSVRSNKAHFNNGRGIEGIGVLPHEIVEYDPRDLAQEQDTLILRAEKLLERFPQKDVPYDPAKFGWKR